MDYYGVYPSKEGYRHVLGAVDAATGEIRLFATKDRSAAVTTDCILQGIVLRDGCPLILHTDHAKEFVSKAVKQLRRAIGMQQTTTLGHHPTGNGANLEVCYQSVKDDDKGAASALAGLCQTHGAHLEHHDQGGHESKPL